MRVLTLHSNMLPPSARRLNLVYVNAEVVGMKRMCQLYKKAGGNLATCIFPTADH